MGVCVVTCFTDFKNLGHYKQLQCFRNPHCDIFNVDFLLNLSPEEALRVQFWLELKKLEPIGPHSM